MSRVVVREGPLRGVLFLPPKPGPAIITIYGGVNNGHVPEDRAALLASKGFVTLALAFYGVDDLPPVYTTDGFDLDYFEFALDYMLSLHNVYPKKIGLYGMSLGGSLSAMMMTFLQSKVHACGVSSTPLLSAPGPTRYRGQVVVEGTNFKIENDKDNMTDPLSVEGGLPAAKRYPRRQISIEKSDCPLLVMIGEEDCENTDIVRYIIEKAASKGRRNILFKTYPGTGHLIDLPFGPSAHAGRHPFLPPSMKISYGGHMQPHCLAQFEAWKSLLEFYQHNLY